MIAEITYNGIVRYRLPYDHPDVQKALHIMANQRQLYGSTLYAVRWLTNHCTRPVHLADKGR